MGFWIGVVFTEKIGSYISHELIVRLIPTWIYLLSNLRSTYSKSILVIKSPAFLLNLICSV